jgi:hypothetical protein
MLTETVRPQKKILGICLIATVGIHLVGLFLFYKFPPAFHSNLQNLLVKSLPILRMVPKTEEEKILEEVFEPFPYLSTFQIAPYDSFEEPLPLLQPVEERSPSLSQESIAKLPLEEKSELSLPYLAPLGFDEGVLSLKAPDKIEFPMPAMQLGLTAAPLPIAPISEQEVEETDIASPLKILPQEQVVAVPPKQDLPALPQIKTKESRPLSGKQETFTPPKNPQAQLKDKPVALPHFDSLYVDVIPQKASAYGLPDQAPFLASGEFFSADVKISKIARSKGYRFTLTLKPSKEVKMERMAQNFTFLLDRTNSIEKHHFAAFKKAALRALSMLQMGDTFNIVIFDKKIIKMSNKPISYSKEAYEDAIAFLNKQQHGGLFAAADLYEQLSKLIPEYAPENEINTLILLTDGTTDAKTKKQQESVKKFIEKCKNKATLYTAAVGRNNNLAMLDLVSTHTGGSLLYSDTFSAFPRRLAGLVYRMRSPLARDITITGISQDAEAHLFLHTPPLQVLYNDQPFEIVGTTQTLSDFNLLIEGMHDGNPFRIKKTISFKNAKEDSSFVMKKWHAQENQKAYTSFLKEGKALLPFREKI